MSKFKEKLKAIAGKVKTSAKKNPKIFGTILAIVIVASGGCGIAGGDWKEVSEIINRVTPDVKIIVCYMEQ